LTVADNAMADDSHDLVDHDNPGAFAPFVIVSPAH
jgi:hypothetical protein